MKTRNRKVGEFRELANAMHLAGKAPRHICRMLLMQGVQISPTSVKNHIARTPQQVPPIVTVTPRVATPTPTKPMPVPPAVLAPTSATPWITALTYNKMPMFALVNGKYTYQLTTDKTPDPDSFTFRTAMACVCKHNLAYPDMDPESLLALKMIVTHEISRTVTVSTLPHKGRHYASISFNKGATKASAEYRAFKQLPLAERRAIQVDGVEQGNMLPLLLDWITDRPPTDTPLYALPEEITLWGKLGYNGTYLPTPDSFNAITQDNATLTQGIIYKKF